MAVIARDSPRVFGARIAAAIVYKGKLISISTNLPKTDPFHYGFSKTQHKITLHAETGAIKNALRELSTTQLRKAILYVVRVKGEKPTLCLAKPCKACQLAIATFDIKNVIYTNETGEIIKL